MMAACLQCGLFRYSHCSASNSIGSFRCYQSIQARSWLRKEQIGLRNIFEFTAIKLTQARLNCRMRPAEVLKSEIANRKTRTLVMGAYGHRGFRERLFGSTTRALVENPPCALFLYH